MVFGAIVECSTRAIWHEARRMSRKLGSRRLALGVFVSARVFGGHFVAYLNP